MRKNKIIFPILAFLAISLSACNGTNKASSNQSINSKDDATSEKINPSSEEEKASTSSNNPTSSSKSSSSQASSSEIPAVAGEFSFNETELNTPQEIHTNDQKNYLNFSKPYYNITASDLSSFNANGNSNVSTPNKVTVKWNYEAPTGKTLKSFSFVYGQKADLSDGYEIAGTTAKQISFYNPYLGDNYFKVIANFSDNTKQESPIKIFKVDTTAPRNLSVGNMPNCRDMGGRTTYAGGKIKQGLIYRTSGSKFDNNTPSNDEAKNVLTKQLKVKTEINVANSTSNNVNLSGGKVVNAYMDYGATPYSNLARNAEKIRQVMDVLADVNNYPVFYHCRIGTDRTGITGIMIGGLLGIPFNEVFQDYCFSNFSPIDGQRYPNKASDPNGDDPAKYVDELLAMPGKNFQEQVYNALLCIGVSETKLNTIIDIMTEGNKATLPTTSKVCVGADLTSTGTKSTNSDYSHPATYYACSSGKSVSYKTTFTAGKKDIVVYLGSTNSSNSTTLASCISLKIDGATKTIANTKTLFTAGFGQTQQNHRTGYMVNLLGQYDLTAGEHTIEIASTSGTFNFGSIGVFDYVRPAA